MQIKENTKELYAQGEIFGLVVSDLGLTLPDAPVFTRESIAMKLDHSIVEANTPRIEYARNPWTKYIGKKWSEII